MAFPVSSLSNVPSLDLLAGKVSEVTAQQPLPRMLDMGLGMFECMISHPRIQGMVPKFAALE